MPSRHELSTIADDRFLGPALDPDAFPVTTGDYEGGWTWTSTSYSQPWSDETNEARAVELFYGLVFDGGRMLKQDTTVEVRCVAGGGQE